MARWRTTHWQHVRERELEIEDPEFARHLREQARDAQIAFVRLMSRYDGMPLGIECKSGTREAWAFVLPDASGEASHRIQYFDARGFSGHFCSDGLVKAIETMIAEGYRIMDPGALDRAGSTAEWADGQRCNAWRELFNAGRIDFREMLDGMGSGKSPGESQEERVTESVVAS